MRLFALATLMTVVSSVTAQTLLEENFSSGFEEWTAVNPPGSFNGSPRWQVGAAGETLFENSNVWAPDSAGMLINDAKTGENYTYKALLLTDETTVINVASANRRKLAVFVLSVSVNIMLEKWSCWRIIWMWLLTR